MFFHSPNHSITQSLKPASTHSPNYAILLSLALGLILGVLAHDLFARDPRPERYEFSFPRMGTIFRIELYSSDDATASKAAEAAFARAEKLEQIMSDYREDSELIGLAREGVSALLRLSTNNGVLHEASGMIPREGITNERSNHLGCGDDSLPFALG